MKILIFIMFLLMSSLAFADGLEVTSEDVTIRFPDAAEPDNVWYTIAISNVSYWQEPVGEHSKNAKLHVPQVWEGLLQKDEPELGKVRFTFTLRDLPFVAGKTKKARRMEICFRVRDIVNGVVRGIGKDFSVPNYVDVIGAPGQPAQQ